MFQKIIEINNIQGDWYLHYLTEVNVYNSLPVHKFKPNND
jgi:hypothetical protein